MKKNIFIGARLRSRDREVIIFENYNCNCLFLATGGMIKKVLGYYWHNGRFSNHMVVTYLLLSSMILTHNVSVRLEHKYYLVKVCVNTNYIRFQTKQKQRRQSCVSSTAQLRLQLSLSLFFNTTLRFILCFPDTDVCQLNQIFWCLFQTPTAALSFQVRHEL